MRTSLVFVALSLVGLCCTDINHETYPTTPELSIQLQGLNFSHSVLIPVTITNLSLEVLYPATMCQLPYFEIDRKNGQDWVRLARQGPLPLCADKEFPITGGKSTIAYTSIADSGYYRLILRYRPTVSGPFLDSSYSKEFVVQ